MHNVKNDYRFFENRDWIKDMADFKSDLGERVIVNFIAYKVCVYNAENKNKLIVSFCDFFPECITEVACYLCCLYPMLYTIVTGQDADNFAFMWRHY